MKGPVLCLLLSLASTASAQYDQGPGLTGYVTRVASSSDFDVNGWHILCNQQTLTAPAPGQPFTSGCPQPAPSIGQEMEVYGNWKRKLHAIAAGHLIFKHHSPADIAGYGIIEAVLSRSPQSLEVRADGYTIRITPGSELRFDAPLHSLADISDNVWINYKGVQLPDGSVRASTARFKADRVSRAADSERTRTDYDPSKVATPGNHVAEAFIGVNAKKIPAWPDAAMQARVSAIGESLIPACQRALPSSDPIRIDFRFQVTAGDPWLHGALALPSGIILVPHQIVERMQNDAQLAAILADAMAVELEAQDSRMLIGVRPTRKQVTEAVATDFAPSWFLPGYGAGLFISAAVMLRVQEEQSARVSLDLMQAAGYDITQAPIAWWLLASTDPKPITDIRLPGRAAYLYKILGTTWREPSTTTQP